MNRPISFKPKQSGFTIVELLIVIVIIGILAALVIVGYNGITSRANDTSLQTDMRNSITKIENFNTIYGYYPTNVTDLTNTGLKVSKNAYQISPTVANNMVYCFTSSGTNYGILASSKSGNKYYINGTTKVVTSTSTSIAQSGSVICPAIGVTQTSWVWLYETAQGGWKSYIAG